MRLRLTGKRRKQIRRRNEELRKLREKLKKKGGESNG